MAATPVDESHEAKSEAPEILSAIATTLCDDRSIVCGPCTVVVVVVVVVVVAAVVVAVVLVGLELPLDMSHQIPKPPITTSAITPIQTSLFLLFISLH
jgi:hypothetical protein